MGSEKIALLALFCAFVASAALGQSSGNTDWPNYGNDPGGMRYSPLAQINRENVSKLQVAWIFHTGDISDGKGDSKRSGFESTPILVDGTLYFTTPFNRVIALDPETGKQRWAYDPKIDLTLDYGDGLVNRGVATWIDTRRSSGQPCRRRIYEATLDARLVAVDAATGKPCLDFGEYGQVNLRSVPGYRAGWYHMTSPPTVIDDLVVIGSAIDDNQRAAMPDGVVRAFDARSERCAGVGIRFLLLPMRAQAKARRTKTGTSAPLTRGRSCLWMCSAISSSCRLGAPVPTTMAGFDRETTSGPIR